MPRNALDALEYSDRKAIAQGEKTVTLDEAKDLMSRQIIGHLDKIMQVRVKAAAFGRGKFGNKGIMKITETVDENGKKTTTTTYEPEELTIKERLPECRNLCRELLEIMDDTKSDDPKSAEALLDDLGVVREEDG